MSAEYTPPYETKDLATALVAVSVVFAVTGPLPDIVSCVQPFTDRVAGTRVEGLPIEDQTVPERLAALDKLHDAGLIAPAEHSEHRKRILGEL